MNVMKFHYKKVSPVQNDPENLEPSYMTVRTAL